MRLSPKLTCVVSDVKQHIYSVNIQYEQENSYNNCVLYLDNCAVCRTLYSLVFLDPRVQVIVEGLNSYEKNSAASSQSLFGPLMMLKAACSSNPGYVDKLVITFIRVAQRLAREHLNTTTNDNSQGHNVCSSHLLNV